MSDPLNDQTLRALRERAAREWFGFGRWDAKYWFIGMEPGGDDFPEIYTSWYHLGAKSLLDAKEHEKDYNRRVPSERRTRFFAKSPKIQQWTWQPLIHIVLGFTASKADSHIYQRDKFGSRSGDLAAIELSATAAKTFKFGEQATYQAERIESLRNRLTRHEPTFAVFYGTEYLREYQQIAGGVFDEAGFYQSGKTLCAVTPHPTHLRKSYDYWREFGINLKLMVG
jgi:hypothetical protein